jgi:hypothetical protein
MICIMCNITIVTEFKDTMSYVMSGALEAVECRYALRGSKEVSSFFALNIHMITASPRRAREKKSDLRKASRKGF